MIDKNYILNLLKTDHGSFDFENLTNDNFNNHDETNDGIYLKSIKPSTFLSIGDNTSISSGIRILRESELNYYLTGDPKDIQPLGHNVKSYHLGIEINNKGDLDAINVNLEVFFSKQENLIELTREKSTLINSNLINIKSHNKFKYTFKLPPSVYLPYPSIIVHEIKFIMVRIYSWHHNEMINDVTVFNPADRLESILEFKTYTL